MNAIRPFHLVLGRVAPIAALVGTLLGLAPLPSFAQAVTTVVTGLSNPTALTVDGEFLYFGQLSGANGTLNRVPKTGINLPSPPPLVTGTALFESIYRAISDIAFDATDVYFGYGGYTNYRIAKAPKSGGAQSAPIAQLGAPLLGVIGSDVYYAHSFCCINKVTNFGTGATTQVLPNQFAPTSMWVRSFAIDGTNIYFQHYFTRDVYRFDTISGISTPLITGNPIEGALFVDATNVYLNRGTSIVKVPKLGGTVSTVHAGTNIDLRAASNGKVYYTENGNLYEIPAAVGAPTLLAASVSMAYATTDGASLYWADISGGVGASKILRISILGDAAASRNPVLLVQGWCGSAGPDTWGEMKSRLETSGFLVDYSKNFPTSIEPRIRRLSSYLALEIERVLNDPILNPLRRSSEVDIVAHSMGGLVTRALIAGMAMDESNVVVPYGANIRRLVELGTPNYGTHLAAFTRLNFPCPARSRVRTSQAEQMEHGSEFIWDLHNSWTTAEFDAKNILTIGGIAFSETNALDLSDTVVRMSSATIADSRVRARFVDRNHISLPTLARGIVDVSGTSDESLLLVQSFLQATDTDSSDPAESECPRTRCRHFEDLPAGTLSFGMLLMRLKDATTGDDILIDDQSGGSVFFTPAPLVPGRSTGCLGLSTTLLLGCHVNRRTSSFTVLLVSPGQYQIGVETYRPGGPFGASIRYGRDIVPGLPRIDPARATVLDNVVLQRARPRR